MDISGDINSSPPAASRYVKHMTNTRDAESVEALDRTPTQSQSADADAHRAALRGLGLASSAPRQEERLSESDKMAPPAHLQQPQMVYDGGVSPVRPLMHVNQAAGPNVATALPVP